jgi:hypothetical protein
MNSVTAKAFRSIATSRQSCRRFQPNRTVPQNIIKDIIEVTNVSITIFWIVEMNLKELQYLKFLLF